MKEKLHRSKSTKTGRNPVQERITTPNESKLKTINLTEMPSLTKSSQTSIAN